MTAPSPEPHREPEWPRQPHSDAPIQDPVPPELQYGSPAPYQTFATVRPGVSGITLSINRPKTGAGLARLRVQIGDRLIPAEEGTVFVTLPPGRHTVSFHRVGTNDTKSMAIDVPPGQAVPLYYSMPFWIGASSVLSPRPVETPGLGSFAAFVVGVIMVVGLVCLVAVAAVLFVT